MNKKTINIILMSLLTFTMVGCSASSTSVALNKTTENSNDTGESSVATNDGTTTNVENKTIKQTDPATYKYGPNSRFKIVSVEQIGDGTVNGQTISVLVDRETKVMYMQNEKRQNGYGLSLEVMVDKDGKLLIYNGELN